MPAVWINENGIWVSPDGADGGSIHGNSSSTIIKSIRLKELLEKENKIDLLKIDIEGSEYEVLKDCQNSLNNVDNIFIEYHSWSTLPQKLSKILNILEINKFRYYIDTICGRKQPLINEGEKQDMDLQLNIFGIRRENK